MFDTLNAKAALFAIDELFDDLGVRLPVMVSGTITDLSGRNLSGQTAEAFWNSVRHARPLTIGLNCALGAKELRPYVAELSRVADTLYLRLSQRRPAQRVRRVRREPGDHRRPHRRMGRASACSTWSGGCCGTTPDHIRAMADAVAGLKPRAVPEVPRRLRLSGLEAFELAS